MAFVLGSRVQSPVLPTSLPHHLDKLLECASLVGKAFPGKLVVAFSKSSSHPLLKSKPQLHS